jgi:hypothetical protein
MLYFPVSEIWLGVKQDLQDRAPVGFRKVGEGRRSLLAGQNFYEAAIEIILYLHRQGIERGRVDEIRAGIAEKTTL